LLSIGSYFFAFTHSGNKFICSVFSLLAGSLLSTAIFSILLGFSDFINYISRKLREIVVEDTYLKDLSLNKKMKLKKIIDEQFFGSESINDPKGPYIFINRKFGELLKLPYRAEFRDIYIYKNSDYEDYWVVENYTTYRLFRNKGNSEKLGISYGHENVFIGGHSSPSHHNALTELDVSIGNENLKLSSNDEQLLLTPEKNNHFLDEQIVVNLTKNGEAVEVCFSIEISHEMFDEEDSVFVKIRRKGLTHKSDKNLFLEMSYPTKDVLFTCEIMEGKYQMDCNAIGITETIKEENSAKVTVTDWVLPGFGAVITWTPLNKTFARDVT
jgi:hypothetical protein